MLLGNAAAPAPPTRALLALAHWIGEQTGATVGYLGEGANRVGAQLVGAMPRAGGLNAGADARRRRAAEGLRAAERRAGARRRRWPRPRRAALRRGRDGRRADARSRPRAATCADVLLPIAPFTETSGTFVNAEGRVQSFHGVVKPLGEARPAWKVLRVLGNLLGLPGFDFETSDEVRAEALGDVAAIAARLGCGNAGRGRAAAPRRAPPPARSSASPTCRSTPPTRSCAARRRCSSPPMRGRRASACRARCGRSSACVDGDRGARQRRARAASCCRRASIRRSPPTSCACRPAIR